MKSSEVQSTKLNVQCQSHMRLCICSEQEANLTEHDATEVTSHFFKSMDKQFPTLGQAVLYQERLKSNETKQP